MPYNKGSRWRRGLLIAGLAAFLILGVVYFWPRSDPGDLRLRQFVHSKPPVPVVFTSRTSPASLLALPPNGEVFTFPGQRLWQAPEGRLRLLTPEGTVHELTWGKKLPDGSMLMDVMSPTVSPDGTKVVFAGRREADAHFRLFEVGIDGEDLRQLTGGPNDPGATAVPPMRFKADGKTRLSNAERKKLDYDDVDPVILPDGRLVFASTRIPDLGRDHARRSCQIWTLSPQGERRPVTANRNTDRWPFQLGDGNVIFSSWSRNREVVSRDGDQIVPFDPKKPGATLPTNNWMSLAFDSVTLRLTMRPSIPVWRPRPLFNGRLAFMTVLPEDHAATVASILGSPAFAQAGTLLASAHLLDPLTSRLRPDWDLPTDQLIRRLRVVQLSPNYLSLAPSSLAADSELPRQNLPAIHVGPLATPEGKPLTLATPSPCPPNRILLAGAVLDPGAKSFTGFGIYLCGDRWSEQTSAAPVNLVKLFDDPEMVDSEPVAVYPREINYGPWQEIPAIGDSLPAQIDLANGRTSSGPFGQVLNLDLHNTINHRMAGQQTDAGNEPVLAAPPEGAVEEILFYAAHRDRFDDPEIPRIPGGWELLRRAPMQNGELNVLLPGGSPTMLVARDEDGQIVKWSSPAVDSRGRQASFYAFAGDHYSGLRLNRSNVCVGCHSGHSGIFRQTITEQVQK